MSIFPGFGGGGTPQAPPIPQAPPPPIERTDPAIAAAKKKLEESEANRRGRRGSMLTKSGQNVAGGSIFRPGATDDNSNLG